MQCVVCYTPQQNLKKEDSRWMKIVQVFFSYLSHHHSRRMSSLNWSLYFGDLSEKDHVYFGHLFLLLQTLMWICSPWLISFIWNLWKTSCCRLMQQNWGIAAFWPDNFLRARTRCGEQYLFLGILQHLEQKCKKKFLISTITSFIF